MRPSGGSLGGRNGDEIVNETMVRGDVCVRPGGLPAHRWRSSKRWSRFRVIGTGPTAECIGIISMPREVETARQLEILVPLAGTRVGR
jgi:hypothetical protein